MMGQLIDHILQERARTIAAVDATAGAAPPRLRTYLVWSFWVGVAFFTIYPTMNWLTSLRARPWHLYLPAELRIPFLPQFVWVYFSMYLLFFLPAFVLPAERMPALGKQLIAGSLVAAAIFVLVPAELGIARQLPGRAPYDADFAGVLRVDRARLRGRDAAAGCARRAAGVARGDRRVHDPRPPASSDRRRRGAGDRSRFAKGIRCVSCFSFSCSRPLHSPRSRTTRSIRSCAGS